MAETSETKAAPASRKSILEADYSIAEHYCPQKLRIGVVLKKAYKDFTYTA